MSEKSVLELCAEQIALGNEQFEKDLQKICQEMLDEFVDSLRTSYGGATMSYYARKYPCRDKWSVTMRNKIVSHFILKGFIALQFEGVGIVLALDAKEVKNLQKKKDFAQEVAEFQKLRADLEAERKIFEEEKQKLESRFSEFENCFANAQRILKQNLASENEALGKKREELQRDMELFQQEKEDFVQRKLLGDLVSEPKKNATSHTCSTSGVYFESKEAKSSFLRLKDLYFLIPSEEKMRLSSRCSWCWSSFISFATTLVNAESFNSTLREEMCQINRDCFRSVGPNCENFLQLLFKL